MKTKTLLLLSLGCAIAILGAGIGLISQVFSSRDVFDPIEYGVTAEVGDLQIAVTQAERSGDRQSIEVVVWGLDDDSVTDSFVVVSGREEIPAEPNDCSSSVEEQHSCEVEFVLPTATTEPAVLLVTRGEERVQWVLAGS